MVSLRKNEFLTIGFEKGQLETIRDFAAFMPGGFNKILSRSLTRAAENAKKTFSNAMWSKLSLRKRSFAHRAAKVRPATTRRLTAVVNIASRRPSLIDFQYTDQNPRGVVYKIQGVAERLPHGFIATMKSGHKGIFMRSKYMDSPLRRGKKMLSPKGHKERIYEEMGLSGWEFRRTEPALTRRLQMRVKRDLNHEINRQFKVVMKQYANRTAS